MPYYPVPPDNRLFTIYDSVSVINEKLATVLNIDQHDLGEYIRMHENINDLLYPKSDFGMLLPTECCPVCSKNVKKM